MTPQRLIGDGRGGGGGGGVTVTGGDEAALPSSDAFSDIGDCGNVDGGLFSFSGEIGDTGGKISDAHAGLDDGSFVSG